MTRKEMTSVIFVCKSKRRTRPGVTRPLFASGVVTVKQIHTDPHEARPPCVLGLTGAAVLSAGCPSHLSLVVFFLGLEPSHFSCMSAHFESRSHVCVGRIFKSNALLPPPLCHFCPYSFISCLSFFFMELQFTFFFFISLHFCSAFPLSFYFYFCTVSFSSASFPCFLTPPPSQLTEPAGAFPSSFSPPPLASECTPRPALVTDFVHY